MSGAGDRRALAMPVTKIDDLDDFASRTATYSASPATRKAVDQMSAFPSRETLSDGQLNLKGPRHILERFKGMCKADRRPYYDMLEILMNEFEASSRPND